MILRVLSIVFLLSHLSSFSQWEQRVNTPFTKDHGIGFSLNGFGYVLTGGQNGQVFSASKDFFKYDPDTDTWEQLADYPGPQRGYGIGDVWDGKVYFGFGTDGNVHLNDLWSWDPASNTFTQLPSCPCSGRVHPAFVIANGKVYAGAGGDDTGNLADFWEYDIGSQNWTQIPSIPGERHHPYQFSIDGDIYVGNGHLSTWYKYTPGALSWVQVASLPVRVAGSQFSYNGKGYALSGTDMDHNRFSTGEFWEYDPNADTWTALTPHPGTSRFAPTQFVIDNYIYFMGGYDRFDPNGILDPYETMWRYDLGPNILDVEETASNELDAILYPNPSNDLINISINQDVSQTASVNIYSMSGRLIKQLPFNSSIDISSLTNGMYILELEDDQVSLFRQRFSKI